MYVACSCENKSHVSPFFSIDIYIKNNDNNPLSHFQCRVFTIFYTFSNIDLYISVAFAIHVFPLLQFPLHISIIFSKHCVKYSTSTVCASLQCFSTIFKLHRDAVMSKFIYVENMKTIVDYIFLCNISHC